MGNLINRWNCVRKINYNGFPTPWQGYPVIDADQVVHELQAKGGKLYQVLVAEFGNSILTAEGDLDRKKIRSSSF